MGSEFFLILVAAFAVISFVYGSVGLGGGSAYIAVMALIGIDHTQAPAIALALNLVVASGGLFHFAKSGFFRARIFLPLIVTSVPAAFFAAQIPISRTVFLLVLGIALLFAGLRLLAARWIVGDGDSVREAAPLWLLAVIGAGLGGLAGITGIGGGIYLAPVLILGRFATPKQTAAISAAFIVVNSVAGLTGRLVTGINIPWALLLPLGVVVLIGGQLGALAGARRLKPATVQTTFGAIVLVVSLRLLVTAYGSL